MRTCFKRETGRLLIFVTAVLALTSCLSDSISEPEPPLNRGSEYPLPNPAVAADGILETVTWNIEWYGSTGNGPADEMLQTRNILQVADSLKADLYAFQEVYSRQRLDSLTKYMTGYRGFTADYVPYNQRMAFVYNTETIDSLEAGPIIQGQDEYDWASRLPLYFSFRYHFQGAVYTIFAIAIHAKANSGSSTEREEAYNRRKRAAESLYNYLQNEHPDAHILLLGDFNDDVDVSVYDNSSPSPYADFVEDNNSFKTLTLSLSEEGRSSYIAENYDDLIDHIIISNELFSRYVTSSEEIYYKAGDFIPDYVATTSDHLPVWAKFDMTGSN